MAAAMTPERRLLVLLLDKFCCRMWHEGLKRHMHWRDKDFVSEQFVGQITTELLDAANFLREKMPRLIWVDGHPLGEKR